MIPIARVCRRQSRAHPTRTQKVPVSAVTTCKPWYRLTDSSLIAKKEAKRLEKEAKLAAKAAKGGVKGPAGDKKQKEKKEKKDEEKPFVNTTPPGQKKGLFTAR